MLNMKTDAHRDDPKGLASDLFCLLRPDQAMRAIESKFSVAIGSRKINPLGGPKAEGTRNEGCPHSLEPRGVIAR
jgi:hypothetical protein